MKNLIFLLLTSVLMSCDFSEIENGSNGVGEFNLEGQTYELDNAHMVRTFDGANVFYGICFSNEGACVDYGLFEKGTKEHLYFVFGEEWTSTSIPLGNITNRDSSNIGDPSLSGFIGALSTTPYGENSREGYSDFSSPDVYFITDFSSPDYRASISISNQLDMFDIEFSIGPMQDGSTLTGSYNGSIDLSPPTPKGLALD